MKVRDLLRKYIRSSKPMQLATQADGQPWICTVYFVSDEKLNLYWLSYPSRRHSTEISRHDKAAVAMQIKVDKPVIGVQAEGAVEVVKDPNVVRKVMKDYADKYDSGRDFYDNFVAGTNQHWLYKFMPNKFVLFDEVNFPDNPRIEIDIAAND